MTAPAIQTVIIYLLTSLSLAGTACAQAKVSPDDNYDKQEAMIPMRDGIKLHTVIFTPKTPKEPLPFLMERTPYGAQNYPSPGWTMYFAKDIKLWCRYKAPGFRSSIATRKRMYPIFSKQKKAILRQPPIKYTGQPMPLHIFNYR